MMQRNGCSSSFGRQLPPIFLAIRMPRAGLMTDSKFRQRARISDTERRFGNIFCKD